MKNLLYYFVLCLLLLSCTTAKKTEFPNKDVCFLLFNINTGTFEKIVNQNRCEERFYPNSSFKVALAVMVFDSKVLKDENSMLKWDGQKRFLEAWNKDQTAASWMKESVVWFSQELTPKIGKERIENYLQSFEYGNADMSAGLKTAWLTPEDNKNSLKVSAFEQVHFLKNLWRGELKASSDAQLKTINLLVEDKSPNGNRLLGKTGSGSIGANRELRQGWWVGFLETNKAAYVVVTNFSDKQKTSEKSFGGYEAKEIAKQLLAEKKLW